LVACGAFSAVPTRKIDNAISERERGWNKRAKKKEL
jgi:hypothetical protein